MMSYSVSGLRYALSEMQKLSDVQHQYEHTFYPLPGNISLNN